MEILIGIVAMIVGGISVFSYLKYGKKWIDIKNIPEEEIARVADKMVGKKISEAEKEIEENKLKSEERLRILRKETSEHEALLLRERRS